MDTVDLRSPNHAPRPEGAVVDLLVLHYTELPLQESLDILCDEARAHRVSAHYVLAEDGTLYRLVPEDRIAWHAGRSHWRGREALNATSIGIEIVNLHGDHHDYPAAQIAVLIELCRGIQVRHPADRRAQCRRPFRHRAQTQDRSGPALSLVDARHRRHRALAESRSGDGERRRGVRKASSASAIRRPIPQTGRPT